MTYVIIYGYFYICNLNAPEYKGFKLVEIANKKELDPGQTWFWAASQKRENAAIFDSVDDAKKFLRYCDGEEDGYSHFPMKECRIVEYSMAPREL